MAAPKVMQHFFCCCFAKTTYTLVMCRGRVSYDGPHIIGGPTLSANAQPALSGKCRHLPEDAMFPEL